MRAVLMSMKPQWWEKILAGEKLLEIRKSAPKGGAGEPEPWPLLVLVYVSGTGAVQGQFSCEGWVKTNYLQFLERPVSYTHLRARWRSSALTVHPCHGST